MGKYINPDGLSTLWNKFKTYVTSSIKTLENKVEYVVTILGERVEELQDNKIDKVEGKQLSTEDFTTILKTKLEGLTNYNDAEITAKIDTLKTRLDVLVGSDNATAVIDTFQEIEAFLQGITNTENLTGLLQEMKGEIVAMFDNYLPKSSLIPDVEVNINISLEDLENKEEYTYNIPISDAAVIYNALINIKAVKINLGYSDNSDVLGCSFVIEPNDLQMKEFEDKTFCYIEITDKVSRFVTGLLYNYIALTIEHTAESTVAGLFFRRRLILLGDSSEFVKADGSFDNTKYLPLDNNGDISDYNMFPLSINNTNNNSNTAIRFKSQGNNIGFISMDKIDNNAYRINKEGTDRFKIWDSGNDGAGSGLSADNIEPTSLNNGDDLNNLTQGFKVYSAGTVNILNTPNSVTSWFSLTVYSINNDTIQVFINSYINIYIRYKNNDIWSDWKRVITDIEYNSLVQRISVLEAKVQ